MIRAEINKIEYKETIHIINEIELVHRKYKENTGQDGLIPQFYHSFKEHQSFPSDTE
jgi:hypothetical protein